MSEKGVIRSVIMEAVRIKGTQAVVASDAGMDGGGLSKVISGEGCDQIGCLGKNLLDDRSARDNRTRVRRQRGHASDLRPEVVAMTLDDLTFECVPMRARFSQHECERQIATGRDYCVNCEHGKGRSTGKFRNGFNSSSRHEIKSPPYCRIHHSNYHRNLPLKNTLKYGK